MEASGVQEVNQYLNRQFYDLHYSNARFRVHQGGTRSGKTWACCQYIAFLLTESPKPLVISIIRKTLPALKGSVQRDFIHILQETGIYWDGVHNKAENTFKYIDGENNVEHLVEFLSIDEPQKIRGRKRNIALLEETNELLLEDFRQINMRTTDFLIMTFNPSDPIHWIYDEIIPRDDCDLWITTYKDNQYLSDELVKEIERMRERDIDYWRVYGEGKRAVLSRRQIYNNWNFIDYKDFPEVDYVYLGLDFGFSNDPLAICEVRKVNGKLFIHEVCYKKGMTNQDTANFLKENGYSDTITYCDSAEPKSIEELKRLNIYAKGAIKGQGSINAGISLIKEFDIYLSNESKNFLKEYHTYYWHELKDGTIINKPMDRMNHLQDALRYVVYSVYSKRTDFFVI
tara:strand:+ start:931 stop:2130 length:1200 start_codon:yes stop_codon:yes gene_type:complete